MAQETPASSLSPVEPPSALPYTLPEPQAKAFAELKSLCKRNNVYWPASELEAHPAHGSNNNVDLLYISPPDESNHPTYAL